MLVHEAIKRVGRIIPTGTQDDLKLLNARFIQRNHETYLAGCNQHGGIACKLGTFVPDIAVAFRDIKAAGTMKVATAKLNESLDRLLIIPAVKEMLDVRIFPSTDFPEFPEFPGYWDSFEGHQWIEHVAQAAGDKTKQIQFQTVQFGKAGIGATDTIRMSLCDVECPFTANVHVSMVKSLPKAAMQCSFFDKLVWFRSGDEYRFCKPYTDPVPPLKRFYDETRDGFCWIVTNTQDLLSMVKRAGAVSELKTIILSVGLQGISAHSYQKETTTKLYFGELDGVIGLPAGGIAKTPSLALDYRYLLAALKGVRTPNVRLYFSASNHPLRVESGPYVAIISTKIDDRNSNG
jgi:hypothetical protein